MIKKFLNTSSIAILLKSINLSHRKIFYLLTPYYALTILNALLEGMGMVLLVNLFTGDHLIIAEQGKFLFVIEKIVSFFGATMKIPGILPILILIFALNFSIRTTLLVFEGVMSAKLRQKLQENVFRKYLFGSWAQMKDFRVGDAVGTTTQEAVVVSKYLMSIVSSVYYLIGAFMMMTMAALANFNIFIVLTFLTVPLLILMKITIQYQSKLSKRTAILRNQFSSDITDRFNGLLQVHVDNNYNFHFQKGLKIQDELTISDIKIGFCQALIGSFSLLLPLVCLSGFWLYLKLVGSGNVPNMALVASVGILGTRIASQLNNAVSAVGNLSRLSGSLTPVLDSIKIQQIPERMMIKEKIKTIEVNNVSFFYNDTLVLDSKSLKVEMGTPLILSGRSGKGKTTLANIMAGLYFPKSGSVDYVTEDGNKFSSQTYRARIGFVTQDIYLFKDTLRTNLCAGRDCTEEQIWSALEQVDAVGFVKEMGGLEVESTEAGRSLSGGQRRRLGIARVLLSGSDILIFDEVTSGLDTKNKFVLINVIEKLKENYIIIMISHEEMTLNKQVTFVV